ncbi:MAG: Ig-like domain-containing protein [Chloroflexota bacterium]|nr:Ig-like domain-containing protein [Chloroflexota bacterium]
MISIRSVGAASRVPFAWFSWQLRRNRVLTRIVVAGVALSIAVAVSTSGAAQTGLTSVLPAPASILPHNVGVGVLTRDAVTLDFGAAMDRASVEEALSVRPSQPVTLAWSPDARRLQVAPARLWLTDQRYLLVVAAGAHRADGWAFGAPTQFSFTTQTAPRIVDFGVRVAGADTAPPVLDSHAADMSARLDSADRAGPPADVAADVSAGTAVTITFGAAMNQRDVERGFAVRPAVPGTFEWDGLSVTFRPDGRLVPNRRYAVSLAGVHDAAGDPLGGDTSFSFTTRPGAQLVKVTPVEGAVNVTSGLVVVWFSQPMNPRAVDAALKVTDLTRGAPVTGKIAWTTAYTHLNFAPSAALAAGHHFGVSLATGSLDADGNALTAAWSFSTKPPGVVYTPRPAGPRPAPSADAVTYALNQINASRSAYGLGPLVLSSAISAVSAAHAWDQLENGYFSHTGLDGSTPKDRLRAAGISFGWSGENECTYSGMTNVMSVLDYCHRVFMSEPYPGYANHIGNILSTHYRKVGIGIAQSGSHVIIVWDFTD